MGFFEDRKIDQVYRNCKANGLYRGTHSENCESCRHVANAKCVTGLVCSGRIMKGGNMVVLANHVCEYFER